MFLFHPSLGKITILTHIFQMGWFNHHLAFIYFQKQQDFFLFNMNANDTESIIITLVPGFDTVKKWVVILVLNPKCGGQVVVILVGKTPQVDSSILFDVSCRLHVCYVPPC